MTEVGDFSGFSRDCPRFFSELAANNHKTWFEEHRRDYEHYVEAPAREFVLALGRRLKQIAPKIQADPRVNKSIFRLYRDTRFSKDKTPYKTHLGLWFWEGARPRMECSGFYFHLEPPDLMLGAGLYRFPKPMLEVWRQSVVDPKHGPALVKALDRAAKGGDLYFGGKHYKKTPRGFDPDHKNAELLLYDGFYAGWESKIPDEFYSPELVDFCFRRYETMLPIHRWLAAMTERAP